MPRPPILTHHSTLVDMSLTSTRPSLTGTAFVEVLPRFQSTTSPLVPRTLLLVPDTRIWREDRAPSLRCRKCTRLSMASRSITRELTTLTAPSMVRGTRFATGVDYTFGKIEQDPDRDGNRPGGDNAMILYIRFPLFYPCYLNSTTISPPPRPWRRLSVYSC